MERNSDVHEHEIDVLAVGVNKLLENDLSL